MRMFMTQYSIPEFEVNSQDDCQESYAESEI